MVEFEIGDTSKNNFKVVTPATAPSTTDNSSYNSSTPNMTIAADNSTTSYQQLQDIQSTMAVVVQTGQLAETINMTVLETEITKAEPPREDPTGGIRATNMTGGPQPGDSGTANLTTIPEKQRMDEMLQENQTFLVLLKITS